MDEVLDEVPPPPPSGWVLLRHLGFSRHLDGISPRQDISDGNTKRP